MPETRFHTKLDNKDVRCTACRHKCLIGEGKRGICGVRMNRDGELVLLVYGRCLSLNADPIEKKPLYHFHPGTVSLSLGTYGCNFACGFCQNHDLSQRAKENIKNLHVYDLPPEEIVNQAIKLESRSISYTYSEPTVWAEYTLDTIALARKRGIKAVYVSNGYQSRELLKELIPVLDAINVDLKSFSDDFYRKYCEARLKPVLENIGILNQRGIHLEVTTLLITGLNDSIEEITSIAKFLASINPRIPWHISRFFPMYKMLDRPPTPVNTLEKAYEIGRESGLKYVYLGNVQDIKHSSTLCPNCGREVIRRVGYVVEKLFTSDLKCPSCHTLQDIIE